MTRLRLIVGLCLVAALALAGPQVGAESATKSNASDDDDGLHKIAQVVADESRDLDDELLGSIVKDFGDQMRQTMHSELSKLIDEVEETKTSGQPAISGSNKARKSSSSATPNNESANNEQGDGARAATNGAAQSGDVDDEELRRLREANAQATREIGARISLAADTRGALPQWNPGQAAQSLLSSASKRLQVAGSFVSDRMRSFGGYVKKRVPLRLRRLIRWPSFLNFKIKFNKSYKSMREELYRQMIYLRSNILNGVQHVRYFFRRDKHLNGPTQFSDWTDQEFHDHFDNKLAEIDADMTPDKLERVRLELEAQRKVGSNLGKLEAAASAVLGKRRQRTKRAASDTDSDDELDETEGEESELENELDGKLGNNNGDGDGDDDDDDDDDDSLDNLRLIEEYANGADLEALDDADGLLDEALKANSDFKHIDLRETNCIPRSENQDGCGACYSYVVNAAAYYYNCMDSAGRKARRYHARFTSDCGKYYTPPEALPYLNGCRGGRMTAAINFTRDVGVLEFGEYQVARISHDFDSDNCAYPRPQPQLTDHDWPVVPVKRFQETDSVNFKFDQIDMHLRTMGPVFVNMRVWPNFKDYYNGIYDGIEIDEKQPIIHSVLLVGHNQDSRGRDYFTIWNSFGIAWGDNGFMHVYADAFRSFAVFLAGLHPKGA